MEIVDPRQDIPRNPVGQILTHEGRSIALVDLGRDASEALRASCPWISRSGPAESSRSRGETTSKNVAVALSETATVPFEGIRLRTATILGQVSIAGKGLAGVTVSLRGEGETRADTTDVNGFYSFARLRAGVYAVAISGYDTMVYSFESTSVSVALGDGQVLPVPFQGTKVGTAIAAQIKERPRGNGQQGTGWGSRRAGLGVPFHRPWGCQ